MTVLRQMSKGWLAAFTVLLWVCASAFSQTTAHQGTARRGTRSAHAKPAAVVKMVGEQLVFQPARVVIRKGQTVEWQNQSTEMHDVTDDPQKASNPGDVALPKGAMAFSSGFMDQGQTYRHTFTVPGTYKYVCTLHELEHMVGEVVVRP